MDHNEFWSLIAESGGDPGALQRLLEGRDKEQLEAFDRLYYDQLKRAYTWDLWGAGYLMNGGMSDDAFDYFCDWLIGRGRETFEKVVESPDDLADVADPGDDIDNEELRYAVDKAYEQTHGEELPVHEMDFPDEPTGEEWDEEDHAALDARFPKVAAKASA